jgi:signal transduction histidine kinase
VSVDADELATLRRERDEARRRVASLSRVIELVGSELALEPLLTRIVEIACELIGAQAGSIGLVKEQPGGPVVQTVAGVNVPARELGMTYELGVGLSGCVLREGAPVYVGRYGDLDRPLLEEMSDYAAVGIPIWWAQRISGVFCVGSALPRQFDAQDVETLTLFARDAAIAIENARLFAAEQGRATRLALMNRIGRLLAERLPFDALVQTAVDAIRDAFDFTYLGAGIVDPADPETLVLRAQAGVHAGKVPTGHRYSVRDGLIGVGARTRRRVLVNDVRRDPRYVPLPDAPGVCAELVVPIAVGDRLLGVLNVESERIIDERVADALEIMADQFGATLENARLVADLQQALATAQLLYQTSQRMSTAMTVPEVVAVYLQQVAAGGRYQCSVRLDEFDAQGRRTGTVVHGRWIAGEGMVLGEQRLPYVIPELDPWLDAGQVVAIRDYRTDPRLSEAARRLQAGVGRLSFAIIPLIVRGRRIGRVNLSAEQVHDWEEAELQPYQVTAALLAAALDSRQHSLELAERGQQLAVLEERRRLARELHDSVTQSLVSMNLLAQVVPALWETEQDAARRHLAQIRELTRSALAEMRTLLVELRPVDQRQPDLGQALRHHAAAFERRTGIAVALDAPAAVSLPDLVAYALSRIAQEALTNVARHARARHVTLALAGGPPTRLVVADDGRGFAPEQIAATSLGLVSMRERAASIGAQLEVHSTPGAGTRVVLAWPAAAVGALGGSDGLDPHPDRGRPPDRAPGAGDGAAPAAGPGGGGRGARRAGGGRGRGHAGAGPGADGPGDAGDGRGGRHRGDQGAAAEAADPGADDVRRGRPSAGRGAGRGGRLRAEGRGRDGAGGGGAAGA